MTEIFDIKLLDYDPDTPSLYIMAVAALLSFFLSSAIAITYEFTNKSVYRRVHFIQALALIGIVASTIMQAIGESVAIGLGIIGALSIIRFRTQLDDPRNITFIFASLAAGIACGVLSFGIAIAGTLIFCLAALVLSYSHFGNSNELLAEIRLSIPKLNESKIQLEKILKQCCSSVQLDQLRYQLQESPDDIAAEKRLELHYLLRIRPKIQLDELQSKLENLGGLRIIRFNLRKDPLRL